MTIFIQRALIYIPTRQDVTSDCPRPDSRQWNELCTHYFTILCGGEADDETGCAKSLEGGWFLLQMHLSFSSTSLITCEYVGGQGTGTAVVRTISCTAKISLFLACSTCLPQPCMIRE